jgi:hypothetical protein
VSESLRKYFEIRFSQQAFVFCVIKKWAKMAKLSHPLDADPVPDVHWQPADLQRMMES